jgi:hypothetical protein
MSCRNESHSFRDYPTKHEPDAKDRFYANYNAHKDCIFKARNQREAEAIVIFNGGSGNNDGPPKIRGHHKPSSHYGPNREDHLQHEQDKNKTSRALAHISEGTETPNKRNEDTYQLPYRNCVYCAKIFQGHAENE